MAGRRLETSGRGCLGFGAWIIGTEDFRANAGSVGAEDVAGGPARMTHVSAQGNLRIMECQIVEYFRLLMKRANMKTEKYAITALKKSA